MVFLLAVSSCSSYLFKVYFLIGMFLYAIYLFVSLWQELLLAGADPNAVDDEGESVLHRAVAKKYTDCALIILENGGSRSMGVRNLKNMTYVYLFCVAYFCFDFIFMFDYS